MTIKIKRGDNFVYLGVMGLLNEADKKRADDIYETAQIRFRDLNKRLVLRSEINSLKLWHLKGKLINELVRKFKISDTEAKYFWLMLHGVTGTTIPERARKFHIQNDFRIASILAKYKLLELKKIGPWAIWREILSSTKIGGDERVAKWVTEYILNKKFRTRDEVRPLLKFVRNRLKNLNTNVLSSRELVAKLNEIKINPYN